jgi:hypothetical protein
MSEFTSGTVRDLRYLYENVVHGEQEVLDENYDVASMRAAQQASAAGDKSREAAASKLSNPSKGGSSDPYGVSGATKSNPTSVADKSREVELAQTRRREDITAYKNRLGTASPTLAKSAPTSTDYKSPFARERNAKPGLSDIRGGGGNIPTRAGASAGTGSGAPSKPSTTAPGSPARALPPNAKATAPAAKPAGSAMDQWAKANPKLAAASAERARIRGTAQTDNPLMKDMKSSLPMNSPSVQAPAVAKLGAGNQSLSQNQNAFKAAPVKPAAPAATPGVGQRAAAMPSMGSSQYKATTPSAAIAAAPSASPAASGSVVPTTDKIAAMKQQPEVKPKAIAASYEYDAYDLVLEYLLDDGHAVTIAEAEYIMTELDSEVINQIVETRLDPRGRPASGPMNVYANPKGKPDQAHLDAVKAYDEKQKKKTPEQRKKELDAYIARQRNK